MIKNLFNKKIDAYLIESPKNRFYFTGFSASWGYVLLHESEKILYVDPRYAQAAKESVKTFKVKCVSSKECLPQITADLKELGVKTLGYEDTFISVASFKNLKASFKEFSLKPASEFIAQERIIKNSIEIDIMRAAQKLAEKAFNVVVDICKPGVSERDIKTALIIECLRLGAEEMSFAPIVAFGENTSIPHHKPSTKKLEKNDVILIDFGVKLNGYCSDMTRTFCLGNPSEKMQHIYNTVLGAQKYVLQHLKSGLTCKEVDALAREYIKSNGYDKEFSHGLGHGIGLDIHEDPFVNMHRGDILLPGMVVTVEPGVYIEGIGGVRIEDMVVIKENGIDNLTTVSKEFIL